ncbi:MAG TPA: DUF971 domain-containing protein [Chloroflexia bacterium]|nr:DUF971 domain-containing protein [Chloroflexia bacterium]
MSFQYIEPEEIEVDRDKNELRVKWNDGHAGFTEFSTLRWNCPCASCRGEMGIPGRLDFVNTLSPDEMKMDRLEAVGLYALKPVWKDGHETGLYTYEHLRDLCQCAQCMAEKPDKFKGRKLVK